MYNKKIIAIFNTKIDRVDGNAEEYIKALKRNVLYFTKMGDTLNKSICDSISTQNIPDVSKCNEEFREMQITLKVTDEMAAKYKRVEVYDIKYKTNTDKINALQYDYAFLDIYTSLIYYVYLYISSNKNLLNPLYGAKYTDLSNSIDNICYAYTKMYLSGELL